MHGSQTQTPRPNRPHPPFNKKSNKKQSSSLRIGHNRIACNRSVSCGIGSSSQAPPGRCPTPSCSRLAAIILNPTEIHTKQRSGQLLQSPVRSIDRVPQQMMHAAVFRLVRDAFNGYHRIRSLDFLEFVISDPILITFWVCCWALTFSQQKKRKGVSR